MGESHKKKRNATTIIIIMIIIIIILLLTPQLIYRIRLQKERERKKIL